MQPQKIRSACLVLGGAMLGALLLLGGQHVAAQSPGGVKAAPLFNQKIPNAPGKTMTVVAVDFAPGASSKPHRHPASGGIFVYVASGTVRSQVEGEEVKVVRTGESWFEAPNAHHVLSANASATEPARIIAVVVNDEGAQATVYDP
jgi:quercetin dioxygenase-like cupin family protein